MKKTDRELGMDRNITRRDFIYDAGLVALGLSLPIGAVATGDPGLALGGTHNLEFWQFSDTVNAMMDELGVDTGQMLRHKEFGYGRNGKNGPAVWFDSETYGQDKLLTGGSFNESDPDQLLAWIDEFPISEAAREQLKQFCARRANVLANMSEDDATTYLEGTSYTEFLRQHGGLGDEAIQLFDTSNHGSWGVETRSLSVAECVYDGMPGLQLLGEDRVAADRDYEREVRTVLKDMLGPAGFNVIRDVLAITVNRWPHGYAHDYLDLWDPDWPEGEAPHEIASRPFGNITMANSDAGADAYTHVTIDQAFRAVQELA